MEARSRKARETSGSECAFSLDKTNEPALTYKELKHMGISRWTLVDVDWHRANEGTARDLFNFKLFKETLVYMSFSFQNARKTLSCFGRMEQLLLLLAMVSTHWNSVFLLMYLTKQTCATKDLATFMDGADHK